MCAWGTKGGTELLFGNRKNGLYDTYHIMWHLARALVTKGRGISFFWEWVSWKRKDRLVAKQHLCQSCGLAWSQVKLYFSKSENVFDIIKKWICPIWQMYLSEFKNVFVAWQQLCQWLGLARFPVKCAILPSNSIGGENRWKKLGWQTTL